MVDIHTIQERLGMVEKMDNEIRNLGEDDDHDYLVLVEQMLEISFHEGALVRKAGKKVAKDLEKRAKRAISLLHDKLVTNADEVPEAMALLPRAIILEEKLLGAVGTVLDKANEVEEARKELQGGYDQFYDHATESAWSSMAKFIVGEVASRLSGEDPEEEESVVRPYFEQLDAYRTLLNEPDFDKDDALRDIQNAIEAWSLEIAGGAKPLLDMLTEQGMSDEEILSVLDA